MSRVRDGAGGRARASAQDVRTCVRVLVSACGACLYMLETARATARVRAGAGGRARASAQDVRT
eukprot:1069630-Pleurochrysis_carterae.AAC.1